VVGQSVLDTLMDMTDELLGDMIEEIIEEYYEDKVDIESEYEDILNFIVKRLARKAGKKNRTEKYLKILEKLRKRSSVAKLILSYLISEYIEERDSGALESRSSSREYS